MFWNIFVPRPKSTSRRPPGGCFEASAQISPGQVENIWKICEQLIGFQGGSAICEIVQFLHRGKSICRNEQLIDWLIGFHTWLKRTTPVHFHRNFTQFAFHTVTETDNKVCVSHTFPMESHTICFPYRDWNEQQGLHISHISYGFAYNLLFIPWLKRTTRFAYLVNFLWNFIQFGFHTVTETNNKVCISCQFPMDFHTFWSPYRD